MNAPFDKRIRTSMTSEGQVLIPADVRETMGLVSGGAVDIGVNDRGEVVISAAGPSAHLGAAEQRSAALDALDRARDLFLFKRPTDEIMRELRGHEPLP